MKVDCSTTARLIAWAKSAKAGERFIYHKGQTATIGMDKLGSCAAAWDLYTRGEVGLFQRRVSVEAGIFEYIAVRLRPNTKTPRASAASEGEPKRAMI